MRNRTPSPAAALLALAAAASAVLLGGCAASTSLDYDSRFGDAARGLNAQQLIDAQAPTRNAGVTKPSDGRTVREAMDRHVDSFKQPPATNVINIGVGAGGNGN